MTQLKTLKDFENEYYQEYNKLYGHLHNCYYPDGPCEEKKRSGSCLHQKAEFVIPTIKIWDLQKEAIKWIKELEITIKIQCQSDVICPNCSKQFLAFIDIRNSIIEWIKHFFNITEENLK